MTRIPDEDIFSLRDKNSITRRRLREPILYADEPSLKDLYIPENFKKKEIILPKENYAREIRKIAGPIAEIAEDAGYNPNIHTALYEALLNAHQHGNGYEEGKKIFLGTNIGKNKLEFIVADEGRALHPDFNSFILELRQRDFEKEKFVNWYDFSSVPENDVNNGTGTCFMHTYLDEVRYFRSGELGGLALYMVKNK